jgi:hypothetical protein
VSPWSTAAVTVYRNGRKSEDASGSVLVLSTTRNETIVVLPKGQPPAVVKMLSSGCAHSALKVAFFCRAGLVEQLS